MPVLKPTWVNSGETTLAFDGNLRIVLYNPSDKDECQKDSAAVCYLISGTDKKKLCLRTGKPENFTYQGKELFVQLVRDRSAGGRVSLLYFYFSRGVNDNYSGGFRAKFQGFQEEEMNRV